MRLADFDMSPGSIADAIIRAARMAQHQLVRPHTFIMNQCDYDDLIDGVDYSDAEAAIRKAGGTYQSITTRLGQLSVARRLSSRRGRRFRAMEWLNA